MLLVLIVNGNLKKFTFGYYWVTRMLLSSESSCTQKLTYGSYTPCRQTQHLNILFLPFYFSHSPTYWLCLTELRGALSNCTFSDLEVRCLPCGCLCCLLLRYFLMSVCELIFNKSLLLCGFYVGFRLCRYSYWNDRVTFWVISLQASFIVHRFWTSFCIGHFVLSHHRGFGDCGSPISWNLLKKLCFLAARYVSTQP